MSRSGYLTWYTKLLHSNVRTPVQKFTDFISKNNGRRDRDHDRPFGERERRGVKYFLEVGIVDREYLQPDHNTGRPEQIFVGKEVHAKDRARIGAAVPRVEPLECG